MSEAVIRVENLSKRYRIGGKRGYTSYGSLRESLANAAAAPLRRLRGQPRPPQNEIWALKDVSFEVQQGETLGIIGRNGAGKSTLLKVLSRITKPTQGRVTLRGRVGSLLEVGTGFHPELTGRENIYLNGAILGMRRAEIERKFDEMVDFAEIEQFLETPVKFYSSGMYMRLAFAVAAHLEPEILLVDEVLAVGDVQFQKKCLGKMGEVAQAGRTVLFVSHNMGAITTLCKDGLLLTNGKIETIGKAGEVVEKYIGLVDPSINGFKIDSSEKPDSPIIITQCQLLNHRKKTNNTFDVTEGFIIVIKLLSRKLVRNIEISIRVINSLGQSILTTNLSDTNQKLMDFLPGYFAFSVQFPGNFLSPDNYSITIGVHEPNIYLYDFIEHVTSFSILESGSQMWAYNGKSHQYGNILVRLPWNYIQQDLAE